MKLIPDLLGRTSYMPSKTAHLRQMMKNVIKSGITHLAGNITCCKSPVTEGDLNNLLLSRNTDAGTSHSNHRASKTGLEHRGEDHPAHGPYKAPKII